MRHRLGNAKLQRDTAHRVLMLRNLVSSLVEHDQVTTTLAKAKQAQRLADKLVSLAKKGDKVGANAFLLVSLLNFLLLTLFYQTQSEVVSTEADQVRAEPARDSRETV